MDDEQKKVFDPALVAAWVQGFSERLRQATTRKEYLEIVFNKEDWMRHPEIYGPRLNKGEFKAHLEQVSKIVAMYKKCRSLHAIDLTKPWKTLTGKKVINLVEEKGKLHGSVYFSKHKQEWVHWTVDGTCLRDVGRHSLHDYDLVEG